MKVFLIMIACFFPMVALADGEAEYKYREGVMNSAKGHIQSIVAIIKGQVHMDNLQIHADGMVDVAGIMPDVFPAGSQTAKSEALDAVWDDPDGFKEALDKFVSAANGMAAAAKTGEMGEIGPAIQALGGSCKGCHDNFRQEH
jgi:cytochrome c556